MLRGLVAGLLLAAPAQAQIADIVRIGVLTDESAAGGAGAGSALAARMAVEDLGGTARGHRIEIVDADTQGKPEIASAVARRWFESEGVGAVVGLPGTQVALAVQQVAREEDRTVMITAAAGSEITSRFCSPVSTHWADDSQALGASSAAALMDEGGKSWFFITDDRASSREVEQAARAVVVAGGGTILGTAQYTTGADVAAALHEATASGAKVVGLAMAGSDLVDWLKQAGKAGLAPIPGPRRAAFWLSIRDVQSLGLATTEGLVLTAGFYWDQNESARAFARRFFARQHAMPGEDQALVYTAVVHYLRAIDAAGTDEAMAVNLAMRSRPLDFFGKPAHIRSDGRVLYDESVWRVKRPSQSSGAWDNYALLHTVPAATAFLPANPDACSP